MARNLSVEEVEAMERQAELQKRMRAATSAMENDPYVEARKRRLDSVSAVATRDPGRYAPGTAEAAQREMERIESNRRFDENVDLEKTKSFDNYRGQRDAGESAAKQNAAAEMAKSKAMHGYFDEQGTYHAGSQVNEATVRAQKELEVAGIQGKTAENVEAKKGENQLSVTKQQGEDALKIEQEKAKQELAKQTLQNIYATQQSEEKLKQIAAETQGKMSIEEVKAIGDTISRELTGDIQKGIPAVPVEQLREKYKDNPVAMRILGEVKKEEPGDKGKGEKKKPALQKI